MTPTPSALDLPPLLLHTDRRCAQSRGRSLVSTVAAAVDAGARALLLREKDLPHPQRDRLGQALVDLLAPVGGVLIAASTPIPGAGGVHLAEADAAAAGPPGLLVGRSCHDAAGLARAAAEGCSYATVSPVFPTPSKPGYGPALGLAGLQELAGGCGLPVYALGGVTPGRVADCRRAGAAGVAVMGAVMAAADPAAEVRALLAEWHQAPGPA